MDPIDPEAIIRVSHFINESERDATPANDSGKLVKLESDAKLHPFFVRIGKEMNCGETINGDTTPVPVYLNKTDNELYACDANDTGKLKFLGFVTSDGTDGNPARFQGSGIVGGFSALEEGEKYYVQDTVGTIGTSPGTAEALVGIAISTTELLIQKGNRYASGTYAVTTGGTFSIATGFRPSVVRLHAVGRDNLAEWGASHGGWTKIGGNKCVYSRNTNATPATNAHASYAFFVQDGADAGYFGTITPDDDGFDLGVGSLGSPGGHEAYIFWEAIGEL